MTERTEEAGNWNLRNYVEGKISGRRRRAKQCVRVWGSTEIDLSRNVGCNYNTVIYETFLISTRIKEILSASLCMLEKSNFVKTSRCSDAIV